MQIVGLALHPMERFRAVTERYMGEGIQIQTGTDGGGLKDHRQMITGGSFLFCDISEGVRSR